MILDRGDRSLTDDQMSKQLHEFFDRVKEESRHGQVLVAYDYDADIYLLNAALGGRDANTSARPPFNVFNLQLLGEEFNRTVEHLFTCNGQAAARRHHALIDAWVNRDAFMAVQRISGERSVQECGQDRSRASAVAACWDELDGLQRTALDVRVIGRLSNES